MSSPPSSSESFHTAPLSPASPSPSVAGVEMADSTELPIQTFRYRQAIPIAEQIRVHCNIFLDEQLYVSALTLLNDLVTLGTSHPDCMNKPAIAPTPFHIEIVSALLIHPRYTSQAPPSDRHDLAARSITFLRNVLYILGPINSNLVEAFSLSPPAYTTRTLRRSRNTTDVDDGSSGSDGEEKPERMRGVIANNGRLRRCAKDFWHAVGWAFNCSVKYPKRWQYWKVWLDYMLDVLDRDFNERKRQDEEDSKLDPDNGGDGAEYEYKSLRKCLLVQYLSEVRGRSNAVKRIVRSIFADGGPESLKDFPEVYENETKEVKFNNGQKRKRDDLKGNFGGYDDYEADSFDSSEETDKNLDPTQDEDEEAEPMLDPYLGGIDSIVLRQRILMLLSRVGWYLPEEFVSLKDLYDVFYSTMKQLPLPAFSLLVCPSKSSQLPNEVLISLAQHFLRYLLPGSAPRPQKLTKKDNDELSQEVLERCFLPFAAATSSVDENTKVSILVESLFRLFLRECRVHPTAVLDEAIEKGILARENKCKPDRRKKDNGPSRTKDESDRVWLNASSARLRCLYSFVEEKNEEYDSGD